MKPQIGVFSVLKLNSCGMSLIELLFSMAITTGVILGCCVWMMDSIKNFHFYRMRSTLTDNSALVNGFILNDIQSSGGASAGAWTAVSVSNNCDAAGPFPNCGGSDRITVFQMLQNQFQCEVLSNTSNHLTIENSTGCCLTADMTNHPFIMVLNENFYYGYASNLNLGTCEMDFSEYQGEHRDFTGGRTSWPKASVTFMNTKTIYLDPEKHQLYQFVDTNNNNIFDAKENTLLAEDVYDFQVALGYDFNPTNRVVDDFNSNQDEWLYNVRGEEWGQGVFVNAKQNQLRMVGIGLILGSPAKGNVNPAENQTVPVHVFDGPERLEPGWYLQVQTSKLLLRNMQSY
jgi:hypothetical protein